MRTPWSLDALIAREGEVLGTWTQIAHPDLIDALGAAGYDFTIIDCEHGAFGIETAESLIRACEAAGVAPLLRVPRGDCTAIGKALDAGALGVLAPAVGSGEEAHALVAATRFAPDGTRGACPIVRAAAHSAVAWRELVDAQRACGLIAMIETPEGVRAAEAICATPGIKAVLLGPFDLSVAMGHDGDVTVPDVQTALAQVHGAARAAGCPLWMPVFSTDVQQFQRQLTHWRGKGVRHFAIGADKIFVAQACANALKAARGLLR